MSEMPITLDPMLVLNLLAGALMIWFSIWSGFWKFILWMSVVLILGTASISLVAWLGSIGAFVMAFFAVPVCLFGVMLVGSFLMNALWEHDYT